MRLQAQVLQVLHAVPHTHTRLLTLVGSEVLLVGWAEAGGNVDNMEGI